MPVQIADLIRQGEGADLGGFLRRNPPPASLLQRLGEILDTPGRLLRSLIAGRRDATGADVLRSLGISRNAGFLPSFATEVVLDPLNLLAGVGALTRGGRLAANLAKVNKEIAGLRDVAIPSLPRIAQRGGADLAENALLIERRKDLLKQALEARARKQSLVQQLEAGGFAKELVPGFAAQARLEKPQRAFLSGGLPFTNQAFPIIRGAPILGGLEKVGRGLAAVPIISQARRALSPAASRAPELEGIVNVRGFEGARNIQEARSIGELQRSQVPELERLLKEAGTEEEFTRFFPDLREAKSISKEDISERVGKLSAKLENDLTLRRDRRIREALGMPQFVEGEDILADISKLPPDAQKKILTHERLRRGKLAKQAGQLEEQAQRMREVLATAPEGVAQRAGDLEVLLDDLINRQIRSGGTKKSARFEDLTIRYMERVLSPEAREWRRANPDGARALDRFLRKWGTNIGSQIQRRDEFRSKLTTAVNEFMEKQPNRPEKWFELDFSKSFPQRYLDGQTSILNSNTIQAAARHYIRNPPVGPQIAGDRSRRISNLLAEGPIHTFKLRGVEVSLSVPRADPEKAAAIISKRLQKAGIPDVEIPEVAFNEILGLTKRMADDPSALTKMWDQAMGAFRFGLTVPFPGFHVRNFLTNITMSWMAGASPVEYARAAKLALGAKRGTPEFDRLVALGVFKGKTLETIRRDVGLLPTQKGLARKAFEKVPGAQAVEKLAEGVENFSRAAHFYAMKGKGLSDLEAVQSVRKYLFDYDDLTKFEREKLKRFFLFYQWTRKIIPRLAGEAIEHPGRFALLTRATTQPTLERPEEGLPEFLRGSISIPAGKDRQGAQRVLAGLGSPLEEFAKFDTTSPEGGLGGAARQLARRVGLQLAPPLRAAAELALDKDLFLDRDLLDANKAEAILGKIPGLRQAVGFRERDLPSGQKRFEGDPLALFALRSSPFSRGIREGTQLIDVLGEATGLGDLDPRKGGLEQALKLLTGVRAVSLDDEEKTRALQEHLQALAKRFRREGTGAEFSRFFATGEKGEKDAEAELLQKLSALVAKRRAEAAADSAR